MALHALCHRLQRSLWLLLLLSVAFVPAIVFADSPSEAQRAGSGPSLVCQSKTPVASLGLRFDSDPPEYRSDLTFCQQYRHNTCCNKTHTTTLLRIALPFLAPEVSDECRNKAASLVCAVCDPIVGVGLLNAVCESECDSWFSACKDDFFSSLNTESELTVCESNSLLCFPLHLAFRSGRELCQSMGFEVRSASAPARSAQPITVESARAAISELADLIDDPADAVAMRPSNSHCWRPGVAPSIPSNLFRNNQRPPPGGSDSRTSSSSVSSFFSPVRRFFNRFWTWFTSLIHPVFIQLFIAALALSVLLQLYKRYRTRALKQAYHDEFMQRLRRSVSEDFAASESSDRQAASMNQGGTSRLTEAQLSRLLGSAQRQSSLGSGGGGGGAGGGTQGRVTVTDVLDD